MRALSCRLAKLQNEFDRLALSSKSHSDHPEVVESEISELKVNESKDYLYKIRVTLIYILLCVLTTE